MSEQSEEMWSAYISGGYLLRRYDDGDLLILDRNSDVPHDDILLEPHQEATLYSLFNARHLVTYEPVLLGEDRYNGEVFVTYNDGVYEIFTDEPKITVPKVSAVEIAHHLYVTNSHD